MPRLRLPLVQDGPVRVEVGWRGMWSQTKVSFDGQPLGAFESRKELEAGRTFALSDGTSLTVRLARGFPSAHLQVSRNGRALPGSPADPWQRFQVACGVVFFIAALNVAVGLLGLLVSHPVLVALHAGHPMILEGLLFAALGFWFQRSRSAIPLSLILVFLVVGGFLNLFTVGIAGAVLRLMLVVPIASAFSAVRQLNAERDGAVARPNV